MLGGVKSLCFLESPHFPEHFDIKYLFWQNMELRLCVAEPSKCINWNKINTVYIFFFSGTLANEVLFQAYLLEGVARWNQNRAEPEPGGARTGLQQHKVYPRRSPSVTANHCGKPPTTSVTLTLARRSCHSSDLHRITYGVTVIWLDLGVTRSNVKDHRYYYMHENRLFLIEIKNYVHVHYTIKKLSVEW